MDRLAQDYLKKFRVRVKALKVFLDEEAYSDVIREGQEALELFIKALIRSIGVQPDFGHDPGKQLQLYVSQLPAVWKKRAPELIRWSKKLRKERELAFYGAEDFIPSDEYDLKEADELIEFLRALVKEMPE